jgi:hypothetical protein
MSLSHGAVLMDTLTVLANAIPDNLKLSCTLASDQAKQLMTTSCAFIAFSLTAYKELFKESGSKTKLYLLYIAIFVHLASVIAGYIHIGALTEGISNYKDDNLFSLYDSWPRDCARFQAICFLIGTIGITLLFLFPNKK